MRDWHWSPWSQLSSWVSCSQCPSPASTFGGISEMRFNRRAVAARAGTALKSCVHSFIVSQIALAFILLAGAGLLGLSLQRVMAISPGFQSDHVLTGQILLPWADYSEAGRLKFVESLMDKLDHLPGVLSAGVVNNVPFSGNSGK